MTATDLSQFLVEHEITDALDAWWANLSEQSQSIITELTELDELDDHLPTAAGTFGRASSARGCVRQIAFAGLDVPRTDSDAPAYRMNLKQGDLVHAYIQTGFHYLNHTDEPCTGRADCPHSAIEVETTVDLRPLGFDVSCHADMVLPVGGERIPYEIKSSSAWKFDHCVGKWGKGGAGPVLDHAVQAGISALGCGADEVRLLYVNKGQANKFAQWNIPWSAIEDEVMADLEVQERTRLTAQGGTLPARWAPEFGVIEKPGKHFNETGRWPKPFVCGGCDWNRLCRALPSSEVPLEQVRLLAGGDQ